ncbi:hypothetical protein HCJ76_44075 [Streptomyces sp. MC1]|uniref:hypothetical protein n=1 Tax=Streptomyces sp. MC1 TaxID=295105 RepID=UPI0018CB0703|nr:hypothetical protein [Streptomyces sp. MC1]MBG7704862.1 hypothetical protein [Streptomyces sp. MC1]
MPATVTALAPTFGKSISDLTSHPVIVEMAEDLNGASPDMLSVLITNGTDPTTRFITLANDRFAERTGGERGLFIGTVARAVITAMAELRGEPSAQPTEPAERAQ